MENDSLCGDVEGDQWNVVNKAAVSVRGSRVHGWGLFADQPFKKGAVVAEYVGEYISNAVADVREKMYQERRIQDYQFRVDESLVIDATLRGGHGRYINHSCNPSCVAKIVDGKGPNTHLKRVIIIAQRDIDCMEEITYDYQFPLELDLEARIPCNCGSELCRGFMNWDLPEKGSKNNATRTQKRGGNMRDRIRRLGKKANKRLSVAKNAE
jgi:histone-lysine N-methyltransferase SETD1